MKFISLLALFLFVGCASGTMRDQNVEDLSYSEREKARRELQFVQNRIAQLNVSIANTRSQLIQFQSTEDPEKDNLIAAAQSEMMRIESEKSGLENRRVRLVQLLQEDHSSTRN